MPEEDRQLPTVSYETVKGQEKEAQAGVDRAFDLLFEEVLEANEGGGVPAKEVKRDVEVDS